MKLLLLFGLGLLLGSFVNALVWRIRHERNWVSERSECVHCGHELAAKDLVPVISWLTLRGRCRYCKKPIDDSPLVELGTGALFALSALSWPVPLEGMQLFEFAGWLALAVVLMALLVYDLRYMLLPNKLVAAAGGIVAVAVVGRVTEDGLGELLPTLGGLVAFGGLFYVLFQVSSGKWIGGGDVKLGFVLGAWLADYRQSLLAIFVASLIGTSYVLVLALQGKTTRKAKLPFGPLLIVGTVVMTLYGERIIDWYTSVVLGL